jgi:uncharacterized protein (TIGR03083 family)
VIDDSELRDLDPFDIFDAEAWRLDGFFATLEGEDWLRPSRCAGWRRREVLAHLLSSEDYNHATIDGSVPQLMERAGEAGVNDLNSFNDWGVEQLADRGVEGMLEEWREACGVTRRGLRELGWDGTLQTSVGPYPAGLQALHLAQELAIHADDVGVPVADGERRLRGDWQVRFARFTLRESERPVTVGDDEATGLLKVSGNGVEFVIDEEGLVDACSGRLPDDAGMPADLRELLRVFA